MTVPGSRARNANDCSPCISLCIADYASPEVFKCASTARPDMTLLQLADEAVQGSFRIYV